jgi:hypothetical protein
MVVGDFCRSLVNLVAHSRHRIYGQIPIVGSSIVMGRTQLVRSFLEGEAEWLFMIDSYMTFEPDTLERLLEPDKPIIGGLCFGIREGQVFPTLFVEREGETYNALDWPEDTVTKVDATGAACLLVHRSVFEKMATEYPMPVPWFADEILPSGLLRGEDITFCHRARGLGFPIYVHTGVKVGHVKQIVITEENYVRSRSSALDSPGGKDQGEGPSPIDQG